MGAKKAKKVKKEGAKARYDAKHPTVSFRVSLEEYERLNELRKAGRTFREIVLTGAGLIEKEKEDRKALYDEAYKKGYEEGGSEAFERGRRVALRKVKIGVCSVCGKPIYWNLTSTKQKQILEKAVIEYGVRHGNCKRSP